MLFLEKNNLVVRPSPDLWPRILLAFYGAVRGSAPLQLRHSALGLGPRPNLLKPTTTHNTKALRTHSPSSVRVADLLIYKQRMKHRSPHTRHKIIDPPANGQHTAITINNNGSSSRHDPEASKLHRRKQKKGLGGPALKLLALPAAVAIVAPIFFYMHMPHFRADIVTERTLSNPISSVVRMSPSTSHPPRTAMYQYRIRKSQLPDRPRATAVRRRELYNKESRMMSKKYAKKLKDSHDYDKKARDPLYEGDCEPMRPWQEMLFPSCSKFHEMDMTNLHSSYLFDKKNRRDRRFRKINSGGYNDVFNFHVDPPNEENIVYKVLNYGSEYTDRNYDRVRRDALIMERGTKSEYLIDIYGHCGMSLVRSSSYDFALSWSSRIRRYI